MLYLLNDNLLGVDGLTDAVTAAAVNDATVTCTLLDAARGQIGPSPVVVTLTYVASSAGQYQGLLPASTLTGLAAGTQVYLRYSVVTTGGGVGGWDELETVGYRS